MNIKYTLLQLKLKYIILVTIVVLVILMYMFYQSMSTNSINSINGVRTIYEKPLIHREFTCIGLSVPVTEAEKYLEDLGASVDLNEIIAYIEGNGYKVEAFITMPIIKLEDIVLSSNRSIVTIDFRQYVNAVAMLVYKNEPDYIVNKKYYGISFTNKTFIITYQGEDVTSKIYYLPSYIIEDETAIIFIYNVNSDTEAIREPEDLEKMYREDILSSNKTLSECQNNPNCLGFCKLPRIRYFGENNWPIYVSENHQCCKVIDGLNHCVVYPATVRTRYLDIGLKANGMVDTEFLYNIVTKLLSDIMGR